MTRLAISLIVTAIGTTAQAATPPTQPAEERAWQQLMPQSKDPIWQTFAHSRITTDLKRGVFLADHPADVRALDRRNVTIEGFMLSTSIPARVAGFILTRCTPVGAFCPPGAPNEAVQVNLIRFAGRPTTGLVTAAGRLHVSQDAANGLFFAADKAETTSGARS